MDKLDSFDVSELDSDRGFLASSSDEDDNTSKKHTPSLSHRLSALFHTEKSTNIDKKAVTSNPQSASTIYSAIVHLFVLQNGGYEGRGRCGVAVILQNDQPVLIIYNNKKERIAHFVLKKDFLVAEVKEAYLNISSSLSTCSLKFDSLDELEIICSVIVIFCQIPTLRIEEGSDHPCHSGDALKYNSTTVTWDGSNLKISNGGVQKSRISPKAESFVQSAIGLRKSSISIFRLANDSCVLFKILKVKHHRKEEFRHRSHSHESTDECSLRQTQTSMEKIDSAVNTDNTSFLESSSDSSLKMRMSKIGQAIIPNVAPEQGNAEGNQHENTADNEKQASTDSQQMCPSVSSYSHMHRIVGVEMDRLEIRLEAALTRIVQSALEPLNQKIDKMEQRQEELMQKIELLERGNGINI